MRFLFFIALGFFLSPLAGISQQAYAQDLSGFYMRSNPERLVKQRYLQKSAYVEWVVRAKAHKKGQFPFAKLALAYAGGPDYDPYGTETIDILSKIAFDAEQTKDSEELKSFYNSFNQVVNNHLGNYAVVSAAIVLVRQNENLGDLEFLQWIKAGLITRLLSSGDGYSIPKSYMIISLAEEGFLLSTKKKKLVQTEFLSTGNQFYHVHLVEDKETQAPQKIYTNMGLVMNKEITDKRIEDPYYRYVPDVPDDFN